MLNQPSKTNASGSQEPKITIAEVETEYIHPSIWIFVALIVGLYFLAT
jgi:hypothetical protein